MGVLFGAVDGAGQGRPNRPLRGPSDASLRQPAARCPRCPQLLASEMLAGVRLLAHQQTFKPAVPCDYCALDSSGVLS
jgi:hypothetical protein